MEYLIVFLFMFILGFLYQFYRDPERKIPEEKNIIFSPADGKVIEVSKVIPQKVPVVKKKGKKIKLKMLENLISDNSTLVSIFMGPFDVHVNRSPISGTIAHKIYVKGKFQPAYREVYSENERLITVIAGDERVIMIQIAGIFARRIQFYFDVGDKIKIGERVGRIVFGSQVVLIYPDKYLTSVKVDEKVRAGETVIAKKITPDNPSSLSTRSSL